MTRGIVLSIESRYWEYKISSSSYLVLNLKLNDILSKFVRQTFVRNAFFKICEKFNM